MSDLHNFILLAILVFLSAFFSASETALVNLNKLKLQHMVKEHVKNADVLEKLYENESNLLGAILIGNNLVNIAASSIATAIATKKFSNSGIGLSIGITTLVILVFGELTPKNFALKNSENISLKVAPFFRVLVKIFTPVLFVLTKISHYISVFLGFDDSSVHPVITQDELKTIVDVSNKEGVLEVDETEMIRNIFEFRDLTVSDIMIQRMDIVSIEIDAKYEEVLNLFKEKKLSRIPVYRDTIDDIVGVVYAKDMFFTSNNVNNFSLKKLMRKPVFINEFVKISDFFKKMQENKIHIAIVLDEYGGVAGIITMEDLIESIVGDIYDEYDKTNEEIKKIKDDVYIINGNSKLADIYDETGIYLESEDYESLAGYIFEKLGKIPQKSEVIDIDDYKFIILDMDKNRINKVKIVKNSNKAAKQNEDSQS